MHKYISVKDLRKLLKSTKSFALIDVREEGEFSTEQILFSNCIPISWLELKIYNLVPNYKTLIVLIDNGKQDIYQRSIQSAVRLNELGYKNILILEDGINGWKQSGYKLFSGINVVSKAFGEFILEKFETPHMAAYKLYEKMINDENIFVIDSRPAHEYRRMNIPGAINVPVSELIYRFFEIVYDHKTLIVINCAGRTRSIIGAQTLINAQVPNRVMALENGIMGWQLKNLELAYDSCYKLPIPSKSNLVKAYKCSQYIANKYNVKTIDNHTLSNWIKYKTEIPFYLFDVRLAEEYASGHLKRSLNAPGTQLIQATDNFIAIRNAYIILVDDNEIRATLTASWLNQLGWKNVFVLKGGIKNMKLVQNKLNAQNFIYSLIKTIDVSTLNNYITYSNEIIILDVSTSKEYSAAHIPGAYWIIRSRIKQDIDNIPDCQFYVVTSSNQDLSQLAAKDLQSCKPKAKVRVLYGGNKAWFDARCSIEKGMISPASKVEDLWYRPYEKSKEINKAINDYLDWEVNLLEEFSSNGIFYFE